MQTAQWTVSVSPQHGPTGQKADNASYENPLVSLEEEHRRTAIMHINIEHGGEVLMYMDGQGHPLRYALHNGVEDAMRQAGIEYGILSDEWETVMQQVPLDRPWKDGHIPKSRRSRRR